VSITYSPKNPARRTADFPDAPVLHNDYYAATATVQMGYACINHCRKGENMKRVTYWSIVFYVCCAMMLTGCSAGVLPFLMGAASANLSTMDATEMEATMMTEIPVAATDVVSFTSEEVTYIRYYADADGESHFGEVNLALMPVELPVGPPINLSVFTSASQVVFLHLPAGYSHDWLPVPTRTLWFYVSGEMEITVSDGETRPFSAGSVVLAEDTTGKGHRARVVGDGEVLLVGVELPE
jgi:hypothetical protein